MFDLSPEDRATLAEIERDERVRQAILAEHREDAASSDRAARDRLAYFIGMAVSRRWEAAGYTSARLVDGLPRPEKPHAAVYYGGRCLTCGRPERANRGRVECPGPSGFDLVYQALVDGVPFGLVDGLPTAGVRPEPGDVVEKLARATCTPVVPREERQAA